jgi:16S rRNA (uracil1498-N3)-methyltransferase
MPRFFLPPEFVWEDHSVLPDEITLSSEDAFHLSVSLRARIGDEITVCTADGWEIQCVIFSITGGKKTPRVALRPLQANPSESEPKVKITVFQGMPKGKKTDSIIQKCTELGASRIVFVYSDHCVPVAEGEQQKGIRFHRIAEEAAKQCGRGRLVSVDFLPNLDRAIDEMKKHDLCFACYENEEQNGLKTMLSSSAYRSAAFFIGPEGGISSRENDLLRKENIPTVSLGKRILRTETAASAVLAMFLYETELE